MKTFQNIAFATLFAIVPVVAGTTGCSSDADTSSSAPAAEATGEASLAVIGQSGEKNVAIGSAEVQKVIANTDQFTVDGEKTNDFSKILAMKAVAEFQVGDQTRRLLRDGNLLRLEGSQNSVAIEVAADKFTIVSDAGRWDCLLKGLSTTNRDRLAGAMTLGILAAFDEDLMKNAADIAQGRCEAVCVVTVGIVVGVIVLASLAAFIVCETAGQSICLNSSVAKEKCEGRGGIKKVEKHCDIMSFVKSLTGGRSKFSTSCTITCQR